MYFIKKIRIITENDTVSELPLDSGVNIIYGPSNTGKSLICECIDFLFGGDARKLKKPVLKVKSVALELDVDGKKLTLFRELESNQIIVTGDADGIEKGTYATGKGSKKTPPINKLWLHLMGIEDVTKIYQYQNKSTQSLTVRTFIHTFLINETRMGGDNSILKSGEGYTKNIPVATLTALIYLATENNYGADVQESPEGDEVVKAKKSATQKLVDLSMAALSEKRFTALPEPKDNRSVDDIQKDIDELLATIESAEEMLGNALARNQELASSILKIDNKYAECKMLKSRYSSLRSQYESDIRRLTFIAEGELHKENIKKIEYCPFCNGELDIKQSESCVEAAIAEVDKIELQIADLREADIAIEAEMQKLVEKKREIMAQKEDVQMTIRGELRPKVDSLRDRLSDFTAALEHAKAAELVDSFVSILKEKMDEVIDDGDGSENAFDIRSKVKEVFTKLIDEKLTAILKSCNYENFVGARFDIESCDVVVNGSEKMTQGQGFRAFLNAVMAIVIQECLEDYNKHLLPLMLIDSPIMSLKEREENVGTEVTTNSMRSGLFNYMIQNCACRQTIILENEIPNLKYDGVNLIHFTKRENDGIYGLIKEYRE